MQEQTLACLRTEGRLIVFLELVRGCDNTECPSWGGVCRYDGLNYMSESTLHRTIEEINNVLTHSHPFTVVDIWTYGCGDSLEHPYLPHMLDTIKVGLGKHGKLSMAIDSRRSIPSGDWYKHLDKIKIIHKIPEMFDWVSAAERWSALPIKMSHKLITNRLTLDMWQTWKDNDNICELKAVPWHDISLGTNNPVFTKRALFSVDGGVPIAREPYPGLPVRRAMISWDGSPRRCLVAPTKHTDIKSLLLGKDDMCHTCFPLTGAELAKFHKDRIAITPSASCVSDGYYHDLGDWDSIVTS